MNKNQPKIKRIYRQDNKKDWIYPEPYATFTDVIMSSIAIENAVHAKTKSETIAYLKDVNIQLTNAKHYIENYPIPKAKQVIDLINKIRPKINELIDGVQNTTNLQAYQMSNIYPSIGYISNLMGHIMSLYQGQLKMEGIM